MAIYRRELTKNDYTHLKRNYQTHLDSKRTGGFAKNKRHRLMGIKGDGKEELQSDADFWYDVRESIKNGITDIKLVSDVASPEQQKMMFDVTSKQFSIIDAMHSILNTREKYVVKEYETTIPGEKSAKKIIKQTTHNKIIPPTDDEMAWKSYLAYSLVKLGVEFFLKNLHVESNLHKRNLEDSIDVLRLEMTKFSDKLSGDQKSIMHRNGTVWKDFF